MSALTEALADAQAKLDDHKREHDGRYVIGCAQCWEMLCVLRDLTTMGMRAGMQSNV